MKKTKILLADDHALFRSGLKMILSRSGEFEVAAEAADGEEVLALLAGNGKVADLIIMDIRMPGRDGLETLAEIRNRGFDVPVLLLTMYGDEAFLRTGMESGANGYILKKAVDSELLTAVRTVLGGEAYVYPTLVPLLYQKRAEDAAHWEETEALSPREIEVLRYIALGYTQKEIGEKLFISGKTVDTYKTRIQKKLKMEKRSQLVRYAIEKKIIQL